jgi:AcrR family transcriptional regulator
MDTVYPHDTDTPYPCQGCGGYTVPMSAPPVSGSETEETTRLILEAAGEIIATEDFDALSMRRVATTAGVSLSTVVRHFGTKDALLAALVAHGGDDEERNDHRARMRPGDVTAAVRIVVEDYEEAGTQLLHMLGQEHRFPALSELLDVGRRGHRQWVRWAFAPQLAGRTRARKGQLEDLLVVATDLYTWKLLRMDRRLSAPATRAAMRELCEALMAR